MKKIRPNALATVGLSVAALTLLSACGGVENSSAGSGGSGGTSLQMANPNPPSDSTAQLIDWWAEEVDAAAPDAVNIEQKSSGSLLAGPDMLAGVGDGRAAGGQLIPAYYPTEMPLANITSVPVQYDSETIAKAYWKLIQENDQVAAEYSDAGLAPLFVGPTGHFMIANSEPVTDLDDLQGAKIRMIPPMAPAYEELGVEPVFVSSEELYESVERGVLDGAISVLNVLHSTGLQEVAPHFVIDGLGDATIWVMVMNQDQFDALDSEVQDAMTEVSSKATEEGSKFVTDAEAAACQAILDEGGTFTALPEDDQAQVAKAAEGLVEGWFTGAEDAGFERADLEAIWDEYNSYLEEMAPTSTAESGIESCL
jgi:TRAP-type C4-dicarboxylate transport system substrate-binding protein